MSGPYDDIIHLPHHSSDTHPRMSRLDRAAQFSPFAALSTHGAAVLETERLTVPRVELGEDAKAVLDFKQHILSDLIDEGPDVTITWFISDPMKNGGRYVTSNGRLRRIDGVNRILYLTDGTVIPIDDVLDIQSDVLKGIFPDA